MKEVSYMDPLFQNLRVEDLTAYRRKSGWKRTPHPNDRILVFTGGSDDQGHPLEMILPQRNDYADSPLRLAEAINLLAAVETRTPHVVVQAIQALDHDVLRMRIVNYLAAGGSLSLELAVKLIQGLRNLLSYAACVEEDPKPYFAKATGTGKRYVDRCRFGHTFAGSFGFTIESPIPPTANGLLPGIEVVAPFERRVMERTVRGLLSAQEAVLSGDVAILTRSYKEGLNANMCEVLLEMGEDMQETELEYSVLWSPQWKAPTSVKATGTVRIERKTYQYLEAAVRELRTVDHSLKTHVQGRIVQLRSETAPLEEEEEDTGRERTVTILWEDGQGRQMRLRVFLDPPEYRAACDAHKEGRTVSVKGTLEKVGKFWTLMAPQDFKAE